MKQRVFRGKRIRPSDKDLVFHFTVASLLPILLLVVGLFHVKTIQQVNWQDFNLSQADKIDIPYLSISFSVAILVCLLVAFYSNGIAMIRLNNSTTVKSWRRWFLKISGMNQNRSKQMASSRIPPVVPKKR